MMRDVPLTVSDVHALLAGLRDGLRADGYELAVVAAGPRVQLEIQATPAACEDCLVSKELMVGYVVEALHEMSLGLTAGDVDLRYPADERPRPGHLAAGASGGADRCRSSG
jgi:hypothetical protein